MDADLESVRAALNLAMASGEAVRLVLGGDVTHGARPRVMEGIIVDIGLGSDGRERVVLGIAEDTQQVVLLTRIARVTRIE